MHEGGSFVLTIAGYEAAFVIKFQQASQPHGEVSENVGEGLRQRAAPQERVPQGRAVAAAMFQAFADAEVSSDISRLTHRGRLYQD